MIEINQPQPGKDDDRNPSEKHDSRGNLNDGKTGYSGGADVFSASKSLKALGKVTTLFWKNNGTQE